jgi:hypothetical protein
LIVSKSIAETGFFCVCVIVMPRRSKTSIPALPDLIRRTCKLRQELVAMVSRFPEDHLGLADKIFPRLLNPVWRKQIGGLHGPYDEKQSRAVRWIERLVEYLQDLEGCISGVMLRPELFRKLPLSAHLHLSADECIRRLVLQEAALKRFQAGHERAGVSLVVIDSEDKLRERLRVAVERYGVKQCASLSELSSDTISDIMNGAVAKPQEKTREKLEKLFASLGGPKSKAPIPKNPASKVLRS